MKVTWDQATDWAEKIRKVIFDSSLKGHDVEMTARVGMTLRRFSSEKAGVQIWKQNDTRTITILINGGARDDEDES